MGLFDWFARKVQSNRFKSVGNVNFRPLILGVDNLPNIEAFFIQARRLACGLDLETDEKQVADIQPFYGCLLIFPNLGPSKKEPAYDLHGQVVVVITPGAHFGIYGTEDDYMDEKTREMFEHIMPKQPCKNIAAIANTQIIDLIDNPATSIPFLSLLTQLARVGHRVWVFEGHESRISAGCAEADIVIIDEVMLPFLKNDFRSVIVSAMRGMSLWVFDREENHLVELLV